MTIYAYIVLGRILPRLRVISLLYHPSHCPNIFLSSFSLVHPLEFKREQEGLREDGWKRSLIYLVICTHDRHMIVSLGARSSDPD